MTEYRRLANLDDPNKPWRSVWETPSGFYIKIYAKREVIEFGKILWRITGSVCDAGGDTIRRGDENTPLVLGTEENPVEQLFQPTGDPIFAAHQEEPLGEIVEVDGNGNLVIRPKNGVDVESLKNAIRRSGVVTDLYPEPIVDQLNREILFVVARVERIAILDREASSIQG